MSNIKIIDNTSQIKGSFEQKASVFLRTMAEEMIRISTPKTPKKTGRLRMDILKQVLGLKGKVKWGKNYGVYQETKQFKNYTTAGTGPHFAEKSAKELPSRTNTIAKKVGLI
jgi:hypothetical protein